MFNQADIVLVLYSLFILTGLPISFYFVSHMVGKTGMFFSQSLIAIMINLFFGLIGIVFWFLYSLGVNEFLFFGGLAIGTGTIIVSTVILVFLIFIKKKRMLDKYQASEKNTG